MFTISKLAKLSGVTEKAIRLYEKKGLISTASRSESNYRYFSELHLKELQRISSLKSLGLTLEEIRVIGRSFDNNAEETLNEFYLKQFEKTEIELKLLEKRKQEIAKKINVTQKLLGSKKKGVTMSAEVNELLNLKNLATKKYAKYGKTAHDFIERENFFDSEVKIQFIEDVKAVIKFIDKTKIKIGPLRGSASSSLILDILGLNSINPLDYGLIPERFNKDKLYLDFDVEFERGSEFIWFCKELTHDRDYKFEAYKLPIIDIVAATEKRIKKKVNVKKIDDFGDKFKQLILDDDFRYIPGVDFPDNTQCFKIFESKNGSWDQSKNLKMLNPQSVLDMWGFSALEGRNVASSKFHDFLHCCPNKNFNELPVFIQEMMTKNRGHLLYQEEWLTVLAHYLDNDFTQAEGVRTQFRLIGLSVLEEIKLPEAVKKLLIEEFQSLFNFSHIVSTWQQTKIAAYLKTHYREVYLDEVQKFESKNPNYSWADFGFKSDGLILMQS